MMYPLVALCFIQLSIVAHEMGHVLAMRARGVDIQEIGLGYPIKRVPSLRRSLWGIPIKLSPLFIGGYVRMTSEGAARKSILSYKERACIDGAGILANIFFGLAVLFCLFLPGALIVSTQAIAACTLIICTIVALWSFRVAVCSYLIPIFGMGELGYFLVTALHGGKIGFVGPIGAGRIAVQHSRTLLTALVVAAVISIFLGAINALPIPQLDGGNILLAFAKEKGLWRSGGRWDNGARTIGMSVIVTFIVIISLRDAGKLMHHF
jgi:membrane-associated protease RseP (regulator of RpoE activity)